MVIEIRRAGFTNKGAAMMLISTREEIARRVPDARVAVVPDETLPFEARAAQGLWHRAEYHRFGVDLGCVVDRLPERVRRRYGFVSRNEVALVLDAAGFAYTDEWGPEPTEDLARRGVRWRHRGTRLILLPQAFGPFTSERIRKGIRQVVEVADLVFARDEVSLQHLNGVVGDRPNVRQAPDFTALFEGAIPQHRPSGRQLVAVVPNQRMIDMTDDSVRSAYPEFLVHSMNRLRSAGLDPFFLIHEGVGDRHLAREASARLGFGVEIVEPTDPAVVKGLLACCVAVVASRYHAIISSLSQGVPVLGTGWSHKYRTLFAEYGCPEMLVDLVDGPNAWDQGLSAISDSDRRSALAERTRAHSVRVVGAVAEMWDEVFAFALP